MCALTVVMAPITISRRCPSLARSTNSCLETNFSLPKVLSVALMSCGGRGVGHSPTTLHCAALSTRTACSQCHSDRSVATARAAGCRLA
jgi:hypothetical protein